MPHRNASHTRSNRFVRWAAVFGVVLAVTAGLALLEMYRLSNPQHYYYGVAMPIEEIGALNQGAYCYGLNPYTRLCFSTAAELDAFTAAARAVERERASGLPADVVSVNPTAAP
jgi:hypothetical protein